MLFCGECKFYPISSSAQWYLRSYVPGTEEVARVIYTTLHLILKLSLNHHKMLGAALIPGNPHVRRRVSHDQILNRPNPPIRPTCTSRCMLTTVQSKGDL